jgi:predicted dehydrogenase
MLHELLDTAMLKILIEVIVYVNATWVIVGRRHVENIEKGIVSSLRVLCMFNTVYYRLFFGDRCAAYGAACCCCGGGWDIKMEVEGTEGSLRAYQSYGFEYLDN